MKFYFYIFFIAFAICQGKAQVPSWQEIEIKDDIDIEHCLIDSLGFLWALSNQGLYKYDGYEFLLKLSPQDDQESFVTFSQDENNWILIGSDFGKLVLFNPYESEEASIFSLLDSIPITKINCPNVDKDCLLISYGNGISIKKDEFHEFVSQENRLVSNEIYDALWIDSKLTIASDQGVQSFRIEGSNIKDARFSRNDQLLDVINTSMIESSDGLWITYFSDSISQLRKDTVDHYRFDNLGRIQKVDLFNNSLFIASENGLFELDEGGLIQKYPNEGRASVKDFSFDSQGNIWVINGKRKLLKASLLFQKFSPKINQIQALQIVNNEIWIGNKDGLFRLNENKLVEILGSNITCLDYRDELIWAGTFSNGIFVLNKQGQILQSLGTWEGYDNQSVLSMHLDSSELLVSSLTGVVKASYDLEARDQYVAITESLNSSLGEGYYYQILRNDDLLYFATDGNGIQVLDEDSLAQIKEFEGGDKIGSVYSMAFSQDDVLWFSSSNYGLGYLENGIANKRKQRKNNFDQYTSLKTLPNGNVLMIRSGSIDILDPERNQIVYYEEEVGISDEPPFLNSIDISGQRAIFSHNDFVYQYQNPTTLKFNPEIIINSVLVNLNPMNENHILNQDENNIQFNYTGSWLTDPNKLSYQYKLEGFDNNWRETKDRSISYPKLEPGQYNFHIKASVGEAYNANNGKIISFRIKRHFYNTWWFWSLIVLTLIFIINKWRDAKRKSLLEQVEIEKKHVETQLSNLKSQLNPHFLFNSFNTLMGLIEENQSKSLSFVEKLTDFYRLVLEQGKNQLIPLNEEMSLVRLFVDILNERFNNALYIKYAKINDEVLIPPLTLQLLIENAVKHNEIGHEKKLLVNIFEEDGYIVVKNNLSPKKYTVKSTGSGLNNIKKRYLLLNPKTIKIKKTDSFFAVYLPIIHLSKN